MLRTSGIAFAVVAGVASLAFGSTAYADGMEGGLKGAPAPALRDGWSGLYIGAGGGAGRVDRSSKVDTEVTKTKEKCKKWDYDWNTKDCKEEWHELYSYPLFDFTSLANSEDWEGFGTVQIGYDRLIGNRLLIGAFADVDIYFGGDDDDGHKYFDGNFDLNHTLNIGGRLGALVTPNILLYGVGGYTRASLDSSIHVPYGPKLDDFDDPDGWFAGGGGEVKLRPGVSLKLEYRYADYGSFGDDGSASWSWDHTKRCYVYRKTVTVDSKAEDDLEIQSVRALLVFRLDEPEAPAPLK